MKKQASKWLRLNKRRIRSAAVPNPEKSGWLVDSLQFWAEQARFWISFEPNGDGSLALNSTKLAEVRFEWIRASR
jgi:hypothetical protein